MNGSIRTTCVIAAVMGLCLSWAWADLPPKLKQLLKEREQAYYNQYLLFQVEQHLELHQPERSTKSLYYLEVLHTPEATEVWVKPLNTKEEIAFQPGGTLIMREMCYIGPEVIVLTEPLFIFDLEGRNPQKMGYNAYISRREKDSLYMIPDRGISCMRVHGDDGVFTLGLDVSKLYRAKWEHVVERGDRWILYGKAERRYLNPFLSPGTQLPDAELTVELRKSDALVKRLEIYKPDSSGQDGSRKTWEVLQTKRFGQVEMPSLVVYKAGNSSSVYSSMVKISLLRAEPLKAPVKLEVPEGARVVDKRVNDTTYKWQGRLLSEEEVKQLALQQGRLVPEQSPRRRYSVVLFLPAVLFFAGALYLYWRQRRQSSAE